MPSGQFWEPGSIGDRRTMMNVIMDALLLARRRLIAAAAASALVLSACGSETDDGSAEPVDGTDSTLPPVEEPADEPADDRIGLPTEGAILEVGYSGGFMPFEFAFASAPLILVTADGELIRPAAVAEIYPGPLLPQHTTTPITDEGIDALLTFLFEEGMFADVDYESESGLLIADASTATLVVNTADTEYRHEAYALDAGGFPGGDDDTEERAQLASVIEALFDPAAIVGEENLGEETMWVPEAYQLLAQPAADLSGFEIPPTVVDWPAATGVVLADTPECTEVERDAVGDLLEPATQLTFFSEGDETYQVVARPAYPGREC